jgi:hypothetical protein
MTHNPTIPPEWVEIARKAALADDLRDHLVELCRITRQLLDGQLITFPVQTLLAAESTLARAASSLTNSCYSHVVYNGRNPQNANGGKP